MGTAPPSGSGMAMPTPHRVTSRSVRLLKRLGMSEDQAWVTVHEVALSVFLILLSQGQRDTEWVRSIIAIAREKVPDTDSPDIDREESNNADRGGSPAGCPQASQDQQ